MTVESPAALHIPTLPAGYSLEVHESTTSSNDVARHLAEQGAPAFRVVWALRQSEGRGRFSRKWESPEGNLYCSLVLRPGCEIAAAANLGFVASLAVLEAAAHFLGGTQDLQCKWPNDVLLRGRKLSGILLESKANRDGQLDWLVLGIGTNLVHFPADATYPATSLKAGLGASVPSVGEFLEGLLNCFASRYELWEREGFLPQRRDWLKRAYRLGAEIRVRMGARDLIGRFADLDEDGALVLEEPDGRRRLVTAGDVFPCEN